MSKLAKKIACVVVFVFGVAGIIEGIDLILNNAGILGWGTAFLALVGTAAPIMHWPSNGSEPEAP
jgi:hypothetical protein